MTAATDQKTDEWSLPIASMMEVHKSRIEGHEDFVPFMLEAWHIGEYYPSWSCWIGATGDIPQRDVGLHAAQIMASSTGCDYLLFSFDTHMSSKQNNPVTGEPWKAGEMQNLCDEQGYCDTGNIRDNLVVCIIRRSDLKLRFESIPYHFHKPNGVDSEIMFWDNHLMSEWDEDQAENPIPGQMSGRIPSALREAMSAPLIRDRMKEVFGLTPEQFGLGDDPHVLRLHTILAGVRIMSETAIMEGCPDMFMNVIPAENEEQTDIIKRSAEMSGIGLKARLVEELNDDVPTSTD